MFGLRLSALIVLVLNEITVSILWYADDVVIRVRQRNAYNQILIMFMISVRVVYYILKVRR